jgi:hypothetical protein
MTQGHERLTGNQDRMRMLDGHVVTMPEFDHIEAEGRRVIGKIVTRGLKRKSPDWADRTAQAAVDSIRSVLNQLEYHCSIQKELERATAEVLRQMKSEGEGKKESVRKGKMTPEFRFKPVCLGDEKHNVGEGVTTEGEDINKARRKARILLQGKEDEPLRRCSVCNSIIGVVEDDVEQSGGGDMGDDSAVN